ETLRQYGAERLAEAGETEALHRRHRDYFLNWAEAAAPQLSGPEQSAWHERVGKEYDNLRAALEWGQRDESQDGALRLAGALASFWDVRGYFTEGRAHLAAALSRGGAVEAAVRAKALHAEGQLSARQGDYVQARSLLEEGLAISQELGDRRGSAWSL